MVFKDSGIHQFDLGNHYTCVRLTKDLKHQQMYENTKTLMKAFEENYRSCDLEVTLHS